MCRKKGKPGLPVFVLVLAALAASPAAAADPDLIGHWALDDGLGTAAVDSAGGNPGTLVGGPAWLPVGRIGGALAFDGVDDLVALGTPDYSTAPNDLTDQLTITFWFRADDFGTSDARIISRAVGTAEQDHVWMVSTINQTGLRFRLKTGGVTTTLVSATGIIQAGRWYHVGAVYDGAQMRVYLDGLSVAAGPKFGLIDTDPTVSVALGNQPTGGRPFDGQLDDVRLYRRALSAVEIGNLAFPEGNQPPLATFTAAPALGTPPLLVAFDAAASYDVDGAITSYAWQFGDGTSGSGVQVYHTYGTMGDYLAVLTVTDNEGVATSDSVTIVAAEDPFTVVPFTHEVIDAAPPAFTHCKATGDVDGDGLQDVLVAGAKDGEGFFWYRDPNWERYTIVPPGVTGFSTDMAMGDVDGDGDLDAVIPKGFDYGAEPVWFENPRPTGDPAAGPWVEHAIGVAGAHDVELGDIDGDGRLDVVVRWQETTLFLQTAADTWTRVVLTTRPDEGLDLADMDGDGDLDAVISGYWLENPLPGADPALVSWPEHVIATDWPMAVRIHVADLDADGRPDVLYAASESTGERLSWYGTSDPVNGPWVEHVITAVADYTHSLEAADMDLDGDLDVVIAEMHQSVDPDNITIFHNEGGGLVWAPQIVATTGSHNMVVTDLDNDGDYDLVGANHAQVPLEVWRNELNPNARFRLDQWARFVVDPDMPWRSVFVDAVPLDEDQLPDLVAGGWWYRNPGTAAGTWVRSEVGLPLRNMAVVHDFDNDGDLDILGTQGQGFTANSDFAWGRNDGTGAFTIFQNIPSGVGPFLQGTTVSVFQPGGPLEVVLAWESGTDTQMLTVPAAPDVDSWTWRVAAPASLGEELNYGDIDRDGDLDLLQGTQWLRNDGGTWTAFALFTLASDAEPDRNALVDLNRDGRLDAVIGYGHERSYGSLAWYEQPPVATDPWLEHVIDNPINAQSLDLADLDLDGDVDIVMGEHNLAQPTASRLLVYENLSGFGAAWRQHPVYTGDEHHDGTRLFDLEGDGDLDIVSIGFTHRRLTVYENLAATGQVSAVPDPDRTPRPSRLKLLANYPNPFNPATTIRYELPTATRVSLAVYDVRGRLVVELVAGRQAAGRHEVLFAPRGLASGVYLAHLRAGGQVRTVRMLLLK